MKKTIILFITLFSPLFAFVGLYSQAHGQDSYEVDDTYEQANVIVVSLSAGNDGTYTQSHTFHQADDVDWVKFYALASERYSVSVFGLTQTNPYIELYDTNGQFICRKDTSGNPSAEETLEINKPFGVCLINTDGIYFVKVGEVDPANYNSAAAYKIEVTPPSLPELPGYLNGTVYNNFNKPVAGASIVLSGSGGTGAGISLSNGSFVAGAKEGTYNVSVAAPGHSSWDGGANVPGNITVVLTRSYNSIPVATQDKFPVDKNGIASGNVLANDSDGDGDTLYAVLDSNVSHGTLQLNSNGSFTYNGSGANDSFTYHATDTVGNSATVKVALTRGGNLPFLMLLLNN